MRYGGGSVPPARYRNGNPRSVRPSSARLRAGVVVTAALIRRVLVPVIGGRLLGGGGPLGGGEGEPDGGGQALERVRGGGRQRGGDLQVIGLARGQGVRLASVFGVTVRIGELASTVAGAAGAGVRCGAPVQAVAQFSMVSCRPLVARRSGVTRWPRRRCPG